MPPSKKLDEQVHISVDTHTKTYIARNAYAIKDALKAAGWKYRPDEHEWHTTNPQLARDVRALMNATTRAVLDAALNTRSKSGKTSHSPNELSDFEPDEYPDSPFDGPLDEDGYRSCYPRETLQSANPPRATLDGKVSIVFLGPDRSDIDGLSPGSCVICAEDLSDDELEQGDTCFRCQRHMERDLGN